MVYVQCVYDHIESAMPYSSRSLLSRDQRAKASAASNQHHVRFLHLASSDAIRSVATIICKHYLRNRQNILSSRVVNLCTCSLDQWLLKREQVGTAFPNLKCVHKPFFLEKPLAWMVIIIISDDVNFNKEVGEDSQDWLLKEPASYLLRF